MKLSIIVARSKNGVIGKDNKLPWHLPDDMKYFKTVTAGKPVIMGRKTYMSIPEKFRPLPGRLNIVLSRDPEFAEQMTGVTNVMVSSSIEAAVAAARAVAVLTPSVDESFVIGGSEIYALALPLADKLYVTEIDAEFEGDAFFEFSLNDWDYKMITQHQIDDRHKYGFRFAVLERFVEVGETPDMFYFAYGSNMDIRHFMEHATVVGKPVTGVLRNFDIEFNKQSYKNPEIGFANVIPKWGSNVEGVIFGITKDSLDTLDRKEGYPGHYQRTTLMVEGEGDSLYKCVVYIANHWKQKKGLVVTDQYRDKILNGAARLSESYRCTLLEKMNQNKTPNEG